MKKLKGVLGVILLVIIDQVTKVLAQTNLQDKKPIVILKNIFELQYLENRGAAFGILKNQVVLFVILTAITLVAISFVYLKAPEHNKYKALRVILVFLSAGAIGNLIDRVMNNYVIDFLYFKLIDFPIFNIADCYVTVSAALLLVLSLFYYKEEDFAFLNMSRKEKRGN